MPFKDWYASPVMKGLAGCSQRFFDIGRARRGPTADNLVRMGGVMHLKCAAMRGCPTAIDEASF